MTVSRTSPSAACRWARARRVSTATSVAASSSPSRCSSAAAYHRTASSGAEVAIAASPGAGRVVHRLVGHARGRGLAEVVRELGDHLAEFAGVRRLDRLGDLAVGPDAAGGRELLEQRRAHERVPEAVAVEPDLVDEPGGAGAVEQIERVVLVDARDVGEHRHVELLRRSPPRPTAARCVSSSSREMRRPTTSRTPSGRPTSASVRSLVQRPSRTTSAPLSTRWRTISPTKNGLPPVSAKTASASAMPGVVELVARGPFEQLGHAVAVEPVDRERVHRPVAAEVGEHRRRADASGRGRCRGRCRRP